MEAVSLAASIAGLVTLADLVFRAAVRYSKSVKDAPKEVKDLVDEIKDLSLLLHNLSMVEYGLASQPDPAVQANVQPPKPHHLHQCQQLLRRLQTGLPNFETNSDLQKLKKRLKWPFSTSDTKDMLQAIGRHKQTINIALTAQSITKLQTCLSRQEESSIAIQDIKGDLRRILDIETKISLSDKREKILRTFLHVNPRVEFEANKSLRHPMTALWLTEGTEFADWFNTEKSRLWCSGIPGAGKSVIAAAIVDECLQLIQNQQNTALGYFFCTYKDPRTVLPRNILSTLCYQLALQHEDAYQILEAYYDELHPSPHLPMPTKTSRLIEVLHEICGTFNRVYLIIDGLDECGDHTDETVRSMLRISVGTANKNINVALLSRDELMIRERLETHFQWIEIEAHTHDIQLYVASELATLVEDRRLRLRDPSVKDEIVVKLVKGAKGMFRWVTCQLHHLCELPTDRARREALDKLPPTLFETYERILNNIESRSEAVKRLVQRSLLLISMKDPRKTLSSRALCEAISISESSDSLELDEVVDEEEVLRWCGSLVRLTKGARNLQTFQFAHFTVQEFLERDYENHSLLSIYGISDMKANMLFMRLAIRFLTLENFARISTVEGDELRNWNERLESRPFYTPASIHWTIRALLEGDQNTQDLLALLFHVEKTPNFCFWALEVIKSCEPLGEDDEVIPDDMEILTSVLRPDFTPLHMAAALGLAEICQQLIESGAKIDLLCRYGTPLQCAVAGVYIFSDLNDDIDFAGYIWTPLDTTGLRSQERQKTVRFLLSSMAKTDRRLKTDRISSLLSLAVWHADSYETIAELIENGAVVEEGDPAEFQEMYLCATECYTSSEFKREYDQGNAFLRILNVLRSAQSTEKRLSPESRLFSMTIRFALDMELNVPRDLIMLPINGNMSDQYIRDSVLSAIDQNNLTLLETLLLSRRCQDTDLSKLDFTRPDWSPIHIAVQARSLDCLEFLLDWGCDPNARTAEERTSIQMSLDDKEVDIAFALLRYGASTTELDRNSDTLWHSILDSDGSWPLEFLTRHTSSEDRALALRTVSGRGDTPICRALTKQDGESVSLMLEFCNTEQYWKCSKPLYRAAAELGSARVLQVLLDVGIEYDRHDEYDGNPLHWIHLDSDLQLIEGLKKIFSCNQRRTRDSATPFQSLLQRAIELDLDRELPHAMRLLPGNLFTSPAESRPLWTFLCNEIIPFIVSDDNPETMMRICYDLLNRGIANLYEEDSNTSALIPFISSLESSLSAGIRDVSDGGLASLFEECWQWVSDTICLLLERTKYKNELAHEDSLAQLLSLAILRNDRPMVRLLVGAGANCLVKAGLITPFELACLPSDSVTSATLGCLLDHTDPKLLTQRISYPDLGPLHLIAGVIQADGAYVIRENGDQANEGRLLHEMNLVSYAKDKGANSMSSSLNKLNVLLDAGIDPNLPLDTFSPMAYHILRHHFRTAEALLDRGADPWAQGSFSLDSVLAAILSRNIEFLAKVARQSVLNNYQPQWNCTYTINLCNKMHALHVASSHGYLEPLEFYFDRGLVPNLDVKDGNQQTPLHHAALNGCISIIDYLVAHGCDINAASSSGLTPLHLAVQRHRVDAVESLLYHGARQQPCHTGRSPLIYAYNTGNQRVVSLLRDHYNQPTDNHSLLTGRGLQDMREALSMAISRNDLEACRMIHQLGCPLDIDIKPAVTPLVLAIDLGCSASLVEWLLNSNVRSSILTWHERSRRLLTPLHLVLMNPTYNSILEAVVTKHIQESGLSSMYHWNPVVVAVEYSNTEGLILLLKTLKTHCSAKDLSSLVKQTSDTYSQYGPIATCARYNNPEALIYLVNFEGNIDCCGQLSLLAFHEAAIWDRYQIAKYLISRCTRPVENPSFATNPLLSACFEDSFSVAQLLLDTCTVADTLDCFGNNAINLLADSTNSNPGNPNLAILMSLVDHGMDPFATNDFGINACHHMLAHDSSTYLRYTLVRFPRCFSNQHFAWPPAWSWSPPKLGLKRLGNISRNLKLVRPLVNASEFRLLTDLPSCEGHTMLCQAPLQERSEIFNNFIKLGVDIERPCNKHGTPLVVALATGHLSAVKCLVRSGAKLSLSELLHSGTLHALTNSTVKDWVLVGRHYEQAKLAANAWDRNRVPTKGAGVVSAVIRMEWHWRKGCGETMLGYASRYQRLIRDLRGTQVKVIRLYG